ncbi:unnamed protein product [Vicia faba]|uniref:glycerophosphodiester phosphodiesterase n=1 Tax=Vicia faba TaxID=3906 RepID=A0AAV0ZQL6_VICFA|nr:unnamed protein product [Vicia faba]
MHFKTKTSAALLDIKIDREILDSVTVALKECLFLSYQNMQNIILLFSIAVQHLIAEVSEIMTNDTVDKAGLWKNKLIDQSLELLDYLPQAIQDICFLKEIHMEMFKVYFNKIQCFYFEEQQLILGEQIDMPLSSFLSLNSSIGKGAISSSGDNNRDAYLNMSIAVLATLCRVPEIISSEDLISKIPVILEEPNTFFSKRKGNEKEILIASFQVVRKIQLQIHEFDSSSNKEDLHGSEKHCCIHQCLPKIVTKIVFEFTLIIINITCIAHVVYKCFQKTEHVSFTRWHGIIGRLVQKKITGLYGTEFLVFSACFALNNTMPKKGQPLIISNNGASGVYPGSTNLAYQQAIDDGADIIDCSVQMTKDGISFCSNTADLMADTTAMTKFMSRTSNVPEIQPNSGIFSFDLTWNEIQSLQRNASV